MKLKRFTGSAFGLLAVGGLAWGCSSQASDCTANENCGPFDAGAGSGNAGAAAGGSGAASGGSSGRAGSSGASGTSGSGAAGEAGNTGTPDGGCDANATPDANNCVIGDDYGLFVSPVGDDTAGDGTEAKPFATLTKALTLTGPGKVNRLYVCAAEYLEPATVVIPDRVSIYGGFTCDGGAWAYDTSVKALLKPQSAIGAAIDSATVGITLQDLRIDAKDASQVDGLGSSSFGMTINASKGIVLTRVEIHAGRGGVGKAGTDGTKGADGSGVAPNGHDASCISPPGSQNGGQAIAATCHSQGGNGGSGKLNPAYVSQQDGDPGIPGTNIILIPNANGGRGEGAPATTMVGVGASGSAGLPGPRGSAADAIGSFSPGGYVLASGGDGAIGFPGQGGGGGGASLGSASCVGASGAAGGMGGCGGDPGHGGLGGGSSVALLSWQSSVTMAGCTLVAADGGAGGRGGNAHSGGSGKPGGIGGAGITGNGIGVSGGGGMGGAGGNGGNGAGGTGGPSIALVYSGTRPDDSTSPATLIKALGGPLGAGGKVNGTSTLFPGADGQTGKAALEYLVMP